MTLTRRIPVQDAAAAARASHGMWVAVLALAAVVGVVAIVVLSLPSAQKGQNILAIASAGFGVIGAIVGAYFGVTAASRAAEIVRTAAADDGLPKASPAVSRSPGETST